MSINGLALCAGAGGLELALKLAIGDTYRTVGYCERDTFAASCLVARMEDKAMDKAPIWDDIKSFPSSAYIGKVDIISAGFPCQPVSYAGKRQGTKDERWIWPSIARIIRKVGPRSLFLENVPGLLTSGFDDVLGSVAAMGFHAEWGMFSAAQVGSSHKRKRLFILAYSRHQQIQLWRGRVRPESKGKGIHVANPKSNGWGQRSLCGLRRKIESFKERSEKLGDPNGSWLEASRTIGLQKEQPFPPGPSSYEGWAGYDGPQPAICRGSDGLAYNVDRLRTIGNGVVPLAAAYAFRTLSFRSRTGGE